MWPDQVSNPEPLAHVSEALPTAQRGPAPLTVRLLLYSMLLRSIGAGVQKSSRLKVLTDDDGEQCALLTL